VTESWRTLETLELVGGVLCLDFVNTINSRIMPEHDYLMAYPDLVQWMRKVGVLSADQANVLQTQARHNIDEAEAALHKALALRDVLYHLFSSIARQSEPPTDVMDSFIALYGEAVSHSQLVRTGSTYTPQWEVDRSYDAVLWPVAYSAGDLLFSQALSQIKECPGCGWLFLDTSKNQSRRWCSMNTCGARSKMRRYHGKLRASG